MNIIKQFLSEKLFHLSQNDIKGINKELVQYVSDNIYKYYDKLDSGHDRKHLFNTIKHSLFLAKELNKDINMCYVIAAYHDIGLIKKDRDNHHKISADILLKDKNLKKWFDQKQIIIMADAVFDHRASSKHPPRTIYGKIIADADKSYIKLEHIIERSIGHNLKQKLKGEKLFKNVYSHIKEKFGKDGYAKYWLPQTKQKLNNETKRNHNIIDDINKFKPIYEKVAKTVFNLNTNEIYNIKE